MASTVDLDRIEEYTESANELQAKLSKLAQWIKQSKRTVFYTGAGVSTGAGVGDYRGPNGAWTLRRLDELLKLQKAGQIDAKELHELNKLQRERAKAKASGHVAKKVNMLDAQPAASHMAMATLMRLGLAHHVITTNLDGIHRKSGLKQHKNLTNLHGCVYVERCTGCGVDFERNYYTRDRTLHVHDHTVGPCPKCGSKKARRNQRVGTQDKDVGLKDTHINFGEYLDYDMDEAEKATEDADLCIVAGSSMSLRHITHIPFLAKRVAIINLQKTPDDKRCHMRIFAKCDEFFEGLLRELDTPMDPVPAWIPEHSVPLSKLPARLGSYYKDAARRLMATAQQLVEASRLRVEDAKATGNALECKWEEELLADNTRRLNALMGTAKGNPEQKHADAKEVDEPMTAPSTDTASHTPAPRVNYFMGMLGLPASMRQLPPHLEITQTHRAVGDKHEWGISVSKPSSYPVELKDFVEEVEIELHPTFTPPTVKLTQPPYAIKRVGWGTFDVVVRVLLSDGHGPASEEPVEVVVPLVFDGAEHVHHLKLPPMKMGTSFVNSLRSSAANLRPAVTTVTHWDGSTTVERLSS